MRRISYFPYFIFVFLIFVILSLSKNSAFKLRHYAIASVSPLCSFSFLSNEKTKREEVSENVLLENALLKEQKKGMYNWLTFDQRIEDQFKKLNKLEKTDIDNLYWKEFFTRRSEEVKNILKMQLQAIPAKVVFRTPSSWSSSIWINVGSKTNDAVGRLIIAKNSPVVVGDSLVGVVEHVGKTRSQVRLITDSGLIPSVRAIRGNSQNQELVRAAYDFLNLLNTRSDIFDNTKEKNMFSSLISNVINKLSKDKTDYYLAKGEIHGSSRPLWRSFSTYLKGIGFNYNYKDKEGPKRDLITGNCLEKRYDFLSKVILKKGDLLITSGMDGIFPEGLKVAIVSKIKNQKKDCHYKIKAIPTAKNLHDLRSVFVMPPLEGFQ